MLHGTPAEPKGGMMQSASVSQALSCDTQLSGIVILRTCPLMIEYQNDQARACLALLRGQARSGLPLALVDFCLDLLESLRQHDDQRDGWPCHLQRRLTTAKGSLVVRGVGFKRESTCSRLYLLLDPLAPCDHSGAAGHL